MQQLCVLFASVRLLFLISGMTSRRSSCVAWLSLFIVWDVRHSFFLRFVVCSFSGVIGIEQILRARQSLYAHGKKRFAESQKPSSFAHLKCCMYEPKLPPACRSTQNNASQYTHTPGLNVRAIFSKARLEGGTRVEKGRCESISQRRFVQSDARRRVEESAEPFLAIKKCRAQSNSRLCHPGSEYGYRVEIEAHPICFRLLT